MSVIRSVERRTLTKEVFEMFQKLGRFKLLGVAAVLGALLAMTGGLVISLAVVEGT